jgi:branched-chain amino acid transport system ATP-binding protein
MTRLLEVDQLSKSFGGLRAVQDISFTLDKGDIIGLIGPNGAGKSTTFSMISGTMLPSRGSVKFKGRDVVGLRPHRIVGLGLVRTFQATVIYQDASVLENILRGSFLRANPHFWTSLVHSQSASRSEQQRAAALLDLLSLRPYSDRIARTLPYGLQRRLGIAIALATEPELLLLDEPAAGLNDVEAHELGSLIRRIRTERGISVLLVEHHMKLVMGICDRVLVLDHGELIAHGTPGEIRDNAKVIDAYLGVVEHA